MKLAVSIFRSIHHRQRCGIKLGCHPNNRGDPHPKDRTGSTDTNGDSNTGNVTQANGTR